MLLRPLREGDEVITPMQQVAVVKAPADGNGRVLLRYLAVPLWQPDREEAVHNASSREVRIKEALLKYVGTRREE